MHMQGHETGNSHCPSCPCHDESMDHIFQCPHRGLMMKKDDLINLVRSKGIQSGIPRAIMEAICHLLYNFVHGITPTVPEHPSIAAVHSQIRIGICLFPRGFFSVPWIATLRDQKISKLLKLFWLEFTNKLWRNRNKIAHLIDSRAQHQDQETWASKLLWYLENSHVISPLDQFALGYTKDGILSMPGATRCQLVRNLEQLEKIYTMELKTRKMGQQTIRSYFSTKTGDKAT